MKRIGAILIALVVVGMVIGRARATDGTHGESSEHPGLDEDTGQLWDSQDPPHTLVINGQTVTLTGHGTATITSAMAATVTHLSGDIPTASATSFMASTVTHLSGDIPWTATGTGAANVITGADGRLTDARHGLDVLYGVNGVVFDVPATHTFSATSSNTASGSQTATTTKTGFSVVTLYWSSTGTGTRTQTAVVVTSPSTATATITSTTTLTATGPNGSTGSGTGTATQTVSKTVYIAGIATWSSTFTGSGNDACSGGMGCPSAWTGSGTATMTGTNTVSGTATGSYVGTGTDTTTSTWDGVSSSPVIDGTNFMASTVTHLSGDVPWTATGTGTSNIITGADGRLTGAIGCHGTCSYNSFARFWDDTHITNAPYTPVDPATTVCGHPLSSNVTCTAGDVGALPSTTGHITDIDGHWATTSISATNQCVVAAQATVHISATAGYAFITASASMVQTSGSSGACQIKVMDESANIPAWGVAAATLNSTVPHAASLAVSGIYNSSVGTHYWTLYLCSPSSSQTCVIDATSTTNFQSASITAMVWGY